MRAAADNENLDFLSELYTMLRDRKKNGNPETSYSAKLFSKGTEKIAQKVGEEAVEIVISAIKGDRKEVIYESADFFYHILALWVDMGIKPQDVVKKLKERKGVSGLVEKETRKQKKAKVSDLA